MDKHLQCIRCLYSIFHPLGLTLDNEGVCSGCRVHEEKNVLDWSVRWEKIKELATQYKVRSGRTYDCIVPVTGGNDSYFILHTVKNRLGLNPLLVTYNKYFNTPLGIRNLANLRIKFNCDILVQNVNPEAVRKITRTTLHEFGSIYWPCLAGQTVFPVQTALRYKIPLIVWGAHQGLEQVGMFSHEHEVEMTRRYRKDHDLMGFEADDLLSIFNHLSEDDIWQYRYPDDADLDEVGVRGIYLGNYVRWDPKTQHEEMVKRYDYMGASFPRTFDTYDHIDCYNFMDLHDHIKYLKHGFSKVTDHACREIRHGRLTRNDALTIVGNLEKRTLTYVDNFCNWLGIKENGLHFILNQHRSKKIWGNDNQEAWSLKKYKNKYFSNGNSNFTNKVSGFDVHAKLKLNQADKYIIFGKGFHA